MMFETHVRGLIGITTLFSLEGVLTYIIQRLHLIVAQISELISTSHYSFWAGVVRTITCAQERSCSL